jgi:hypothetical protein
MHNMTVRAAVPAVEPSPTSWPSSALVALRSSIHGRPCAAPDLSRYGEGVPAGHQPGYLVGEVQFQRRGGSTKPLAPRKRIALEEAIRLVLGRRGLAVVETVRSG